VWFAGGHCDVGGGNETDEDVKYDTYSPSLANIPLRWMIGELHIASKKYNLNIRWRHERLPRYGICLRVPVPYTNETGLDPDYSPPVLDDDPQNNPSERPRISGSETALSRPSPYRLPRKAIFGEREPDRNGILIHPDYHNADLKRDIEDALWCWKSTSKIILMMMWWFFEFFPFLVSSQSEVTREWKTIPRVNFFRAREAPKDVVPSSEELVSDAPGWREFLGSHSKALFHKSVSERMELKRGYRPAAWGKNMEEWKEWAPP